MTRSASRPSELQFILIALLVIGSILWLGHRVVILTDSTVMANSDADEDARERKPRTLENGGVPRSNSSCCSVRLEQSLHHGRLVRHPPKSKPRKSHTRRAHQACENHNTDTDKGYRPVQVL